MFDKIQAAPVLFLKGTVNQNAELEFNLFSHAGNGDLSKLALDNSIFTPFITDKSLDYLQIADFDEHFEDVSRDWRNVF